MAERASLLGIWLETRRWAAPRRGALRAAARAEERARAEGWRERCRELEEGARRD